MRTAAAILLALAACRTEPPPAYVRVDEPLPEDLAAPGLLAFWGSWCAPCVEETAQLRALARDVPLTVVAVREDGAAARQAFGDAARVIADPEGARLEALRGSTLPLSFFVVGGRAVARFEGRRDWDSAAVREALRRLARPVR